MAGLLPVRPRTGNRLEYLAHYILSAFGTAVPVLRTEDVGVDFFCALGNDEPAGIAITNSYAVQLKSGKTPRLELGGKTKGGTWRDYEISWFLNLEFPLLFGVPHEKEKRLDLYSTSIARFTTANSKFPYQIRMFPGEPGVTKGHLHPDQKGKSAGLKKYPEKCDGRIYDFHLGPPIISCGFADLNNKARLKKFQKRIRELLKTERLNTIYRALGLPYWTWVLEVETNKSHKLGYAYDDGRTIEDLKALLAEIVPFVCALGLLYLKEKDMKKLAALKGIAGQLPKDKIPKEIRKLLAVLFE